MAIDFDDIRRQPYPRIECSGNEYWLVRSPAEKLKIIPPAYPDACISQLDAFPPEIALEYRIALYKRSSGRDERTEYLIEQMKAAIDSGRSLLTKGYYLS